MTEKETINIQHFYNQTVEIADRLYANQPQGYEQFAQYVPQLQEFILPLLMDEQSRVLTEQLIQGLVKAYQIQNVTQMADLMHGELMNLIRARLNGQENAVTAKDPESVTGNDEFNADTIDQGMHKIHHEVDKSYYQKNLEAMEDHKPALYKYFKQIHEKVDENDQTILMDGNGSIAIKKQDDWWYVNSVRNSEYAARIWGGNMDDIRYNNTIVLCGMSNCDYIREVISKMTKDNALVIYEPDYRVFAMNMLYTDISDILTNDNCFLLVDGVNLHKLSDCLSSLVNANTMKYTLFYASPGYDVAWSEELAEFMERCKKIFENIQLLDNTIVLKSQNVNYNVIMNLKFLMNGSTIDELKNTFEQNYVLDVPAIIVASGPSLDKNISYLSKAKNKAFIIATDSALRMLMKYEIMPDIIVTLDPDKERILFSDDRVNDIPMLYSVHATYDILENNRSRKFIYSNMEFLDKLMRNMNKQISIINPGGSVANAGFAAAQYLGFKRIMMIGQDLAFTDNKKHASVVYKEKEYTEGEEPGLTTIEGQDGTMLTTYMNLKNYRDWYENVIEFNPQLHVINATEGGALIHGADHCRLIDAIEKYCDKTVDFKKIIDQADDTFAEEEKDAFITTVEQYRDECEKVAQMTRDCSAKYDQLAACENEKQVKAIDKEIQKLVDQMEHSSIMEFISYYARQVENKATSDLYDSDDEIEHAVWKDIAARGKMVVESYESYADKTGELFAQSLTELRKAR